MKKALLIITSIFLSALTFAQYPAGSSVDCNGQLQVKGFQLCNAQGNAIQLRGMSSHNIDSYSQFFTQGSMATLAGDWRADVVRVSMPIGSAEGTDYISNPALQNTVMDIVNLAGQYGLYAIIDWHLLASTTGFTESGNPNTYVTQAKTFFQNMATKFNGQKHVIYEICNEPSGCNWSDIVTYANVIIPAIRAIDPNALIIVGTPNWCQRVDLAANAPLSYSNILYAFHIYAASHKTAGYGSYLQTAANKIALISTEFSPSLSSGDGTLDTTSCNNWMNLFAGQNYNGLNPNGQKISWCNWSLCDKVESSAALVAGASIEGGWSNNDLTTSGLYIKNKILNPLIPSTCTSIGPFNLTVSSTTGGSVLINPQLASYPKGTKVTLTATANSNSKFNGWTGYLTGKQPSISFTMNRDMIVKALFVDTTNFIKNGDFGNGTNFWILGKYQSTVVPAISILDTIDDGLGHYNWYAQSPTILTTLIPASGKHVGEAQVIVQRPGKEDWNIQLATSAAAVFKLDSGNKYMLTFDAYASKPRFINANVGENGRDNNKDGDLYTGYSRFLMVGLTTKKTTYNMPFVMKFKRDTTCRLEFDCGFYSLKDSVWIDNISLVKVGNDPSPGPYALNVAKTSGGSIRLEPAKTLYTSGEVVKIYAQPFTGYKWKRFLGIVNDSVNNPLTITIKSDINVNVLFEEAKEQIMNGVFFRTKPTFWSFKKTCGTTGTSGIISNQFQIYVTNQGTSDTCFKLYQANLNIENGKKYTLSFKAYVGKNDLPRNIRVGIGQSSAPYTKYTKNFDIISIDTSKQIRTYSFTMNDATDYNAMLGFYLGNTGSGYSGSGYVYIDNVSLKLDEFVGVNDNNSVRENNLKIYPNPVEDGQLTIDLIDINSKQLLTLTVLDIQGRIMYSNHLHPNSLQHINVSSLNKGLYFVTVQSDHTVYKQKFIIK